MEVVTVVDVVFDDVLVVGTGSLMLVEVDDEVVLVDKDEDVLVVVVGWLVEVGAVLLGVDEKDDVLTDEDVKASDVESSEVASVAVAVVDIVVAVGVAVAAAVDVVVGQSRPAHQVSILNREHDKIQ